MQLRDPNIVKVDVPNPDPVMQWTMLSAVGILLLRRSIEWLSSVGSWFVKKDETEIRMTEKLIDYQQKTIDQLIQLYGGERTK